MTTLITVAITNKIYMANNNSKIGILVNNNNTGMISLNIKIMEVATMTIVKSQNSNNK